MAKDKKPKNRTITKEQFAKWSPSHQQRALNDRRTRIRIEDAALPADWLAKRKEARWNRTPITPGSGTTYGDLAKQRAYMEPLTFGEGDRQLADRGQNLGLARQRDADWFQKYRADVQAAQQAAIGAQNAAAQGNQAFIDSANQVAASSRDAIVKQLQDRAAQLGQTDQSAEYRGLADAAAATRAAGMANTGMRQVADANAGVNLATAGVGTAALKDLEARQYRDYQDNLLQKDKTSYASKKDEWRAKFIDDAIAEARKQVLEDQAFGLKAADTQADNKLNRDKLKLDQKKAKLDARQKRRELALKRQAEARLQQQADKRAASGGGSRGSGGGAKSDQRTAVQNRTAKSQISKAAAWASRLRSSGWSQSAIRSGLIQGMNVPKNGSNPAYTLPSLSKDAVNTALDIVYRGYIGPVNYRIWANDGYNPGSWGWKVKRKGR